MIVIDSNVFAKLFTDEPDSEEAKALLSHLADTDTPVWVPTLFSYELVQIARYHQIPVEQALDLLDSQLGHHWQLVEPTRIHWYKAEQISHSGHDKSGYPALYDAIYHAIAITENGSFLTADKKHYAKATVFGHIILLNDWQSLFIH
jgi:predicted nucleic acid-binding protein